MAHEVVKHVGRRAYRYAVESYRDPATKKIRSRWTYLGVVAADPSALPRVLQPRVRRADTRDRLVEAFLALLEEQPYAAVTAGLVAERAGLAHGTFYRYFRDKRAAFLAALDRVREIFDREGVALDGPLGDLAAERARVRAWLRFKLGAPARYAGALRAFYDALDRDAELQAMRQARRALRIAAFRAYLERLAAAGLVAAGTPALAGALVALVDAVLRETVATGAEPDAAAASGVALVFDRALFPGG